MPPLTYFAARLKCFHCGAVSDNDTRTGLSNKLVDDGDGHTLRVGDSVDSLTLGDFKSAFITSRLPGTNEPIHSLEDWSCPICHSLNWAEIVFSNNTVASIESVKLSQAILDSVHFISDDIYEDFEKLVGKPLWEDHEIRPDFVELLKKRLPAE